MYWVCLCPGPKMDYHEGDEQHLPCSDGTTTSETWWSYKDLFYNDLCYLTSSFHKMHQMCSTHSYWPAASTCRFYLAIHDNPLSVLISLASSVTVVRSRSTARLSWPSLWQFLADGFTMFHLFKHIIYRTCNPAWLPNIAPNDENDWSLGI